MLSISIYNAISPEVVIIRIDALQMRWINPHSLHLSAVGMKRAREVSFAKKISNFIISSFKNTSQICSLQSAVGSRNSHICTLQSKKAAPHEAAFHQNMM
jgi:hypothetical protein